MHKQLGGFPLRLALHTCKSVQFLPTLPHSSPTSLVEIFHRSIDIEGSDNGERLP